MTIPLQTGIAYGPLRSRRFGVSLGVNLLPRHAKICNLNCVYCQYGLSSMDKNALFPTLRQIGEEMSRAMRRIQKQRRKIDQIMIAGNGEPTLHPQFPQVVDGLLRLRDEFLPRVPVGILSNSTTCHLPAVREALSRLDGRCMKLDAGSIPAPEVLVGLRQLKGAVLQSLFYEGTRQNTGSLHVRAWIDAVNLVRPESVQLYTVDRPTRVEGLCRVPKKALTEISEKLSSSGIPVEIY